MLEEVSKLHLRFLKSIHPDASLRFFPSTPPINLIQLLLHSPGPKIVARYFLKVNRSYRKFLDAFKGVQTNGRISNPQTWPHFDCFDVHWAVRL